ncbi:MAG: hypothetical protein K2Y14_01655 [Burkholderiales bacterium]|nr:hypothetical protein [Burkholderiales bacterium]
MIKFLVGGFGVDLGFITQLMHENGVEELDIAEISQEKASLNKNWYCVLDDVDQIVDMDFNACDTQILLFYVSPYELLKQNIHANDVKLIASKLETWFYQVKQFTQLLDSSQRFIAFSFQECQQNPEKFISSIVNNFKIIDTISDLVEIDDVKSRMGVDIINQSRELTECYDEIVEMSHPLTDAGIKKFIERLEEKVAEQIKLTVQKEQQLAELNQKLLQSQTQISTEQQEFEQAKLELSKSLETKQAELLQSQAANSKITSESQAQLSRLSAELQAKEAKVAEQIKLTAQKEQQLAELNQKLLQSQTQISIEQQEFEQVKLELSKSLETKQAELLQSQAANSKITSENQAQLSKLTAELQTKEAELVTKQADFSAQQSTIVKQVEEQAIQLNQLNGQLSAKDGLLLAAQAKIDEQSKLAVYRAKIIGELKSELTTINVRFANLEREHTILEQKYALLKVEVVKVEANIDMIKEFALIK